MKPWLFAVALVVTACNVNVCVATTTPVVTTATVEQEFMNWLIDGGAKIDGAHISTLPSGKGRGLVTMRPLTK
jgi:hypothetical protein